ncbi:MAG: amidohydrolase [Chloroflexi bacterium]|nr:amidohydrolase [Chloroflexota bacterium]
MTALAAASGPADLLFVRGAVRTMVPAPPAVSAVAVRAGRIAAVGSDADLRPLVGPRTRVLDLAGRTLLPGFQDAHVHPPLGGQALLTCDLHDLPSDREAYLAAIAAYAAARPGEPWITGGGWAMPAFPGGTPSCADLDAVVPDRPAFLENRDGHGAWVNSRALALAGVTAATADPPDGRIERDADGSPQGTLHEGAAALVGRHVPPPAADFWEAAILAAQARLHGYGITALTDAWVEPHHVAAYRALVERGALTMRTTLALWWDRAGGLEQLGWFEEARRTATRGRLRASTVKLMLDGVLENGTGALLEPYLDAEGRPTETAGIDFIHPRRLAGEIAPALDAAGFQLHFHAIGDRAVRSALDAVAAVRRANGPADRRPHVAHLQVVDPADVPRFAALGVGATIQPLWAAWEAQMRDLTVPFLGPERSARQYPFRSLQRAGARLVGGSDWSVSTPNVLEEVEVAVNRVVPESRGLEAPFLPAERIDLAAALAAFTTGAAWANGLERETGTIEAGRLADLVVLDRDVFDRGAGEIGDARVLLTLSEGVAVHADPALGW